MTEPYLARLARRSRDVGTVLCVGIDPTAEMLPDGWPTGLAGIERLARLVVEAAAPYAAAVKPNLAFFEAYGSTGVAALERVLAAVPAGVLVVADAKRGDVETTVARQAAALFDALGADAVTVNPYLGLGALEAFVERTDRYAYVLCRTSNPGAGELQDLVVGADAELGAPAEALHRRVARRRRRSGPRGTRRPGRGCNGAGGAGRDPGAGAEPRLPRSRRWRAGRRRCAGPGRRPSDHGPGRIGCRRRASRQRLTGHLRRRPERAGGCSGGPRGAPRGGGAPLGGHPPCAIVARPREVAGARDEAASTATLRSNSMPNIGPVELIIILVIALLILGPGRLPDVGSALGKSIREFRKAATDVQDSVKLDAPPAAPAAPAAPVAAETPAATPSVAAADRRGAEHARRRHPAEHAGRAGRRSRRESVAPARGQARDGRRARPSRPRARAGARRRCRPRPRGHRREPREPGLTPPVPPVMADADLPLGGGAAPPIPSSGHHPSVTGRGRATARVGGGRHAALRPPCRAAPSDRDLASSPSPSGRLRALRSASRSSRC